MTLYLMLLLTAGGLSCPNPTWVNGGITLTTNNVVYDTSHGCSCGPSAVTVDFTMNREKALSSLEGGWRVWRISSLTSLVVKEVVRTPLPQEFKVSEALVELK